MKSSCLCLANGGSLLSHEPCSNFSHSDIDAIPPCPTCYFSPTCCQAFGQRTTVVDLCICQSFGELARLNIWGGVARTESVPAHVSTR